MTIEKQVEDNRISIRISSSELYRRILMLLFKSPELQLSNMANEIGVEISDLTPALSYLEDAGFIHKPKLSDKVEKRTVSLRVGENCVVGFDLGGTKLYGAISDLMGNIIYEAEITNHGTSGEACYDMLVSQIELVINESRRRNLKILGIGIDVPGRVHLETGRVVNAPAVNMKDFPLGERIQSKFGCPVYIDNDLKQASLGEAWFGAGKSYRNVVLLAIGTGIAAGMVVDGIPLRGAHLRHGELGWMLPGLEFLGRMYVGFGALETEASGPGIVKRARNLLNGTMDERFLESLNAEVVFEAARNGEKWAQQCIAETVDYLAVLIANIMAFYDPDVIILSGGVSRSSEQLIPPIMKLVEGCVLTQPYIVPSSLGYRAGVLGSIINLVQNSPEFIRSNRTIS